MSTIQVVHRRFLTRVQRVWRLRTVPPMPEVLMDMPGEVCDAMFIKAPEANFDSAAVPRIGPLSEHIGIGRNVTSRNWRGDTLLSRQITINWKRSTRVCRRNTSPCSRSCNLNRYRWIHLRYETTPNQIRPFLRQIYNSSTSSRCANKN